MSLRKIVTPELSLSQAMSEFDADGSGVLEFEE